MVDTTHFDQLRVGLASPEEIRKWSRGEVKKPETINYRTFKPEPDGLFCERIFGPTRDWECHCGKYRKIKFRGITCDRCGVEVTRSKVRRERMGHIELAAPVSHIWYLKGVPSPMALLLDISPRPLEKVLYFASYIVTGVDHGSLTKNAEEIKAAVEAEGLVAQGEALAWFATDEVVDEVLAKDPELKKKLPKGLRTKIANLGVVELLERREPDLIEVIRDAEGWAKVRSKVFEAVTAAEAPKGGKTKAAREEAAKPVDREALARLEAQEAASDERAKELETAAKLLLGPAGEGVGGLAVKQLISENEFRGLHKLLEALALRHGNKYQNLFRAGLGADAIRELLGQIDLDALSGELRNDIRETQGAKRARAIKRLEVSEAFRQSRNRPEWMIMEAVPVIPPELRPMVQLDGGRFATSDLNDLYRRIINRNNRLKKIKELNAPESIINHEKRLLQEAVDALIDNGRRSRPVTGSNNRPLKSLSDMLKGKEGRFRKNLLGKRVDYSGRSVIVVGPHLRLNQCGLPKEMALELFKPFVMKRLVDKGYTTNVKTAKKMVDRVRPEVWDALEEVIKDHPVMLNRAPTLHRLGIQAFEPVLVDGKAIQIHPLVCYPFNADFDGDQMAVHVPLSAAAQAEARILMLSTRNLFSPAHGKPMVTPRQDLVLGCYYLTQKRKGAKGAGKVFSSPEEAILAYHCGHVDLHADVRVRMDGQLLETTVGRVIFNQALPPKLRYVDRVVTNRELGDLVQECHHRHGTERTVALLDELKELGFRFSTMAGITISMTDMDIPAARREEVIARTERQVLETNENYRKGLITAGEREDEICRLWTTASDQMADAIIAGIDPFNPIFMMAKSGARGTIRQITQLAGMRGLMTDPFGRFIEDLPIKSNFHEGLSVLEYFVSTHGARKGLADTALRTADAGYLTRRLVDVAQDVIVRETDCGTPSGISVKALRDGAEEIEPLEQRIEGRTAAMDVVDPRTGRLLVKAARDIGTLEPGPCPGCAADLEPLWICQTCGLEFTPREIAATQAEIVRYEDARRAAEEARRRAVVPVEEEVPTESAAQAAVTAEEEAPPAPAPPEEEVESPELQEMREAAERGRWIERRLCPQCHADLETVYLCGDCGRRFATQDLEFPLEAIKRVVAECEGFLQTAKKVQAGEAAPATLADPFTGEALVEEGKRVTKKDAARVHEAAEQLRERGGLARGEVMLRSSLTCELRQGICARCYGRDLAASRLVEVGEAVGIIAAQSIGEPGTQLTMRTFHTGGVAAQYLTGVAEVKKRKQETLRGLYDDIDRGLVAFEAESFERDRVKKIQQMLKVLEEQVKGLLRVVELFEARRPKGQAIVSEVDGVVAEIATTGVRTVVIHSPQPLENARGEVAAERVAHPKTGAVIVEAGQEISDKVFDALAAAGIVRVSTRKSYIVPYRGGLPVELGQQLEQGDSLTEGPLDPQKVLLMKGLPGVQDYLVAQIQRVYRSQGVDINDKHIEVIVRQMLKKRRVTDPGDAPFLPGQVVDRFEFEGANREIEDANRGIADATQHRRPATAEPVLLGITDASLSTDSFLSAASFQKTTRVLTDAAIKGKTDNLVGLKENVIIGRLIPAGTGLARYRELQIVSPKEERRLFALPRPAGEEDFLLRTIAEEAGDVFALPGPGADESALARPPKREEEDGAAI